MPKKITNGDQPSRVVWENLEEYVRESIQGQIQSLLEEEVTEFLGRERYERDGGSQTGYRNGYGKPRRLTTSCGTVEVQRPRVRDVESRFVSQVLPFFATRTRKVDRLLPELYLHGLSLGDFDLAMRGLLGDEAPISATTIARLKEKWLGEYQDWKKQSLDHLEPVYFWADGVYVKAGLEKEKAALLVIVAGLKDGSKAIVAVSPGYRESTESWSEVLRDLSARGLKAPQLVVADGHMGIWGAIANVYPDAGEQRCWNHRMINVFDKLPGQLHREAKKRLRKIMYADTREGAVAQKEVFQEWCCERGFEGAGALLDQDWDRLVAFYDFPKAHWTHLRTTNIVESPFSGLRLRTGAARRFKKVENATALIWKLLQVAETRFMTLRGAYLLEEVFNGERFVNGKSSNRSTSKSVA